MAWSIQIAHDAAREIFSLRCAGVPLLRIPQISNYLRSGNAVAVNDELVELPVVGTFDHAFQTLTAILKRSRVDWTLADGISDVLQRSADEAADFADFSRRAGEIWRGEVDEKEFGLFVDAVGRLCPGRTLYRRQILSAYHLAFARNACNFSVPGAGKTSVVLAAYAYLRSLPKDDPSRVDRLLIVGPLSAFKAWEDEYEGVFGSRAVSVRISGAVPQRARMDFLEGITSEAARTELVLTSYQTVMGSEAAFEAYLRRFGSRTLMVLDEAHYIKSEDGIVASAVLRLAPFAARRVVLTGTPAPNGYEDLANLFRFIYPSRDLIGFGGGVLRAMSSGTMDAAIPALKDRIRPFFTRIRKTDLGLPPVHEERVAVDMHPSQDAIYRRLEQRIVPQLRGSYGDHELPPRLRARLIRLRQAAVNPELLLLPIEREQLFDAGPAGDYSISELDLIDQIQNFSVERDLTRLQACDALVRRILAEQGKVLIWSYFIANLQRLRDHFNGISPFIETLTGATPVDAGDPREAYAEGTREHIIQAFHETAGPAILLANPHAVGESISLHKVCRSAIYFDRDFNAGRFIQSKDRIHRYSPVELGPVSYYYLVCRDTVDVDIDGRLTTKERRLNDLVDSEEIPLFTSGQTDDGDVAAVLQAYERRKAI